MKTDEYLRSYIRKYFYQHLDICKCDICGSTHDLQVHHSDIQFFEMVDKTMQDLNLKYYSDIEFYSDNEKDLIITYILGLHMRSRYQILCKSCHTKIYQQDVKRRKQILSNMPEIINFILLHKDTRLFQDGKIELFKLIKHDYSSIRYVSTNEINMFFEKYDIPFRLYDRDDNGKRYIDKRRRLPNGEINNNRDKAYWILKNIIQ